jgi:UbiD family decarboxylase
MVKALWDMKPATVRAAPCQQVVLEGQDIDLGRLPVQTCWPGDAGPPARSTRSLSAVISSRADTGSAIRRNSPPRSSIDMKPRRSR